MENNQFDDQAEAFDRELEQLLTAEPEGKKKKKRWGMKKERKPWSRKRKILTAAGAAAALVLVSSRLFGGSREAAPVVSVSSLETGDVQNRLTVTGPVSGTDSVDVVSNLHAEVQELLVKEGDRVEKGQLLARIDRADLEKEAEIAQNSYDLAVVTKRQKQKEAESGYAKALQDCQAAKNALDRTAVLVQSGDQPAVSLEQAQNTYADALRNVNSYTLEGGMPTADESYDLQIKNAEFELEKKKEALDSASVESPISGTVVRVNTKVGQFADKPEDDKPMFIIENLDQLELEIKISEYSIGKVAEGQPVSIHADILDGETVNGVVASISPTGEEKGGGSTERVIPTTIQITDKNSRLIAGITAKAEIILEEAEDTLTVPASAVWQDEDGKLYLQKVENGVIHLVSVEIGVEGDIMVQIIPAEGESLKEGDSYVTTADSNLKEGMAVTGMPAAR
ncbi:MAG: efflux RND transporter periplasmic adaptor subunit [Lachnospiraceae bacterium]|nr:efflux RND transporter periplasmic adaptor subunit [Lachnospiraceae bacterium]